MAFDFDKDELLTLPEVLKLLKVSKSTFYRLLKDGNIETYKLKNSTRFGKNSLQAFLTSQKQ